MMISTGIQQTMPLFLVNKSRASTKIRLKSAVVLAGENGLADENGEKKDAVRATINGRCVQNSPWSMFSCRLKHASQISMSKK